MEQSPVKLHEDWFTKLKDASSLVIMGAGIIYILGFAVASAGMYSYGYLGLVPLVKIRYLLIGISASVYLAIGLSPLAIFKVFETAYRRDISDDSIKHGRLAGTIFAVLICLATLLLIKKFYFDELGMYDGAKWRFTAPLVLIGIMSLFVAIVTHPEVRSRKGNHGYSDGFIQSLLITSLFTLTTASLVVYCLFIYPHLAPTVGGGKPIEVNLLLDDLSRDRVSDSGISIEPNGWTKTVKLLDVTDDYFIIQGASPRSKPAKNSLVTCINKDQVKAINMQAGDNIVRMFRL